jgi:hypothetical protein
LKLWSPETTSAFASPLSAPHAGGALNAAASSTPCLIRFDITPSELCVG